MLDYGEPWWNYVGQKAGIRGVTFRKMTKTNQNQNQTDTNVMATTKTKYQTNFYSAGKYQYLTKFQEDRTPDNDKIQRKYQEISDINTKYRFGIGIFLVYQIFGYRLTSQAGMRLIQENAGCFFTSQIFNLKK